jgi:hypothetical protein
VYKGVSSNQAKWEKMLISVIVINPFCLLVDSMMYTIKQLIHSSKYSTPHDLQLRSSICGYSVNSPTPSSAASMAGSYYNLCALDCLKLLAGANLYGAGAGRFILTTRLTSEEEAFFMLRCSVRRERERSIQYTAA